MERKKKNVVLGLVISVAAVLFIVFGTLACLGVFRGFNAQGYVSAILDQTFKGEVEYAVEIMDGATEETLYAQYEAGVESFVKNTILQGKEINNELEEKYIDLCKKIFSKTKYSVQEAEKISDNEFHVPVTYQPSNVLQLFVASAAGEIDRIKAKNDKIEYRGTLEEIEAKMNEEYLTNCCTLLEEAYNNMEYGKEQTVVIKVIKGEDGLYKLEESAITQFLVKILSLDAKQD
ncbi:MAG: hypothetical protein U0L59_02610 [Faecalimonas sp.]|nr:hypothetical protein [Faecalimonas sp.]